MISSELSDFYFSINTKAGKEEKIVIKENDICSVANLQNDHLFEPKLFDLHILKLNVGHNKFRQSWLLIT